MTDLSVCIVNYQGERHLPSTLDAVEAIDAPVRDVLLVDNGSSDRSVAITRARLPGARVLELGCNRGPGAARNVGFREAESDWILFLDNDVRPDPGTPDALVRELRSRPGAVAATPRTDHQHRPGVVQFAGAAAHVLGLQVLRHSGKPAREVPPEVTRQGSLITACVLLHRGRWGPRPPFDEDFFLYFEDHELGQRARLLGHDLLSVPGVRCRHGPGTEGVSIRSTGTYSDVRIRHSIQNRWQVLIKLYGGRTLLLLLPCLLLFEILQLAGAIRRGWLVHWLAACGWIARRLPSLLRRRKEVQARRIRPDGVLLTAGPVPFRPELLESRLERGVSRLLGAAARRNWRVARRFLGAGRG